jgi:tRNA-Thr(GGU) m(6)t(6)A37 methyltransferase TsaA
MNEVGNKKETYQIYPIGYIRRSENRINLEILEPFRPALKQVDHFSHVTVLWWAHKHDNGKSRNVTQTEPPYARGILTGIFATRAECRPNPIAITTCKILKVDEANGIVQIAWIDAYDGTPIVDLKAYFPVCDRVKEPRVPQWISEWPEWMPEGPENLDWMPPD